LEEVGIARLSDQLIGKTKQDVSLVALGKERGVRQYYHLIAFYKLLWLDDGPMTGLLDCVFYLYFASCHAMLGTHVYFLAKKAV